MSCNPIEEEIRLLTYTLAHMHKDYPLRGELEKQLQDKLQQIQGETYAI